MSFLVRPAVDAAAGTTTAGAEVSVSVDTGVSSTTRGGSRGATTPPTGLAEGILAGIPVLAVSVPVVPVASVASVASE